VVKWEKDANLDHDRTDKLLKAIANLKGGRNHSVSYPVPSGNKQVAA
jgi:CRISPR/Cas system-associated protein Cas7 (RAMP superfamily)